jgi:hypothetical protein
LVTLNGAIVKEKLYGAGRGIPLFDSMEFESVTVYFVSWINVPIGENENPLVEPVKPNSPAIVGVILKALRTLPVSISALKNI